MLQKKVSIGIIWNFAEQLSKKGIGLITTLLLAFFLTPEDYGLVAMMAVFIAIASSLMDSGFKQALIRLPDAAQRDYSTAFFANLGLGLVAYGVLFAAAPSIAGFYEQPRLIELVRVAGLVVLINAFQVVQTAILSRQLNFKAQLAATVPAAIISSIVAVVLAYAGFGVWALVAQMIVSALLIVLFIWRLRVWRPTVHFSRESFVGLYRFGVFIFLEGFFGAITKNIYVIVIAKIFSTGLAGLYFFANKIKELVLDQLVKAIQNVTYPALASIQNDSDRLKNGYRKVIGVTTFLLFPALVFLAALSEPLFMVLLPEKWCASVPLLQLLCLAALLYPLHSINLNILKVKGRADLVFYLGIYKKATIFLILFISYRYGVYGILIGQIINSVLAYIPNSYFSDKLIGYPPREQMADFMPGLLLSLAVGGAVYATVQFSTLPALVELLLFGALAGGFYLFGAHLLKLRAYMMAREILEDKLKRKKS